jgi:hypothetical protein
VGRRGRRLDTRGRLLERLQRAAQALVALAVKLFSGASQLLRPAGDPGTPPLDHQLRGEIAKLQDGGLAAGLDGVQLEHLGAVRIVVEGQGARVRDVVLFGGGAARDLSRQLLQ